MPSGHVQQLASAGYTYAEPQLTKARNMVPLLDATVQRVEPHVPKAIKTADACIDVVASTAGRQVQKVSDLRTSASGRARDIFQGIMALSLRCVDRAEALVDRVLPPDAAEQAAEKASREAAAATEGRAVLTRALAVPCRVPLRVTRIMFVQARGLVEMLKRTPQHFVTLTAPALSQLRVYRGNASRKLEVAWRSAVQAEQAVLVWINGQCVVVVTKLHLPELKAWAQEKVASFRQKKA